MQRFVHVIVGAIAGIALTLLLREPSVAPLITHAIASPSTNSAETYRELELFGKVFELVRKDYVDKPDDTKLVASAISGMLSGLDPHSSYMDAKKFRDMQVETSGEFGGLGMQVTMENGLVKVISPIDGTPAAKAGILAGDVITQVDGEPIKGLPLDRVVARLRGPVGSNVKLAIERQSEAKPIEVTLKREIIKQRPVSYRDEGGNVVSAQHERKRLGRPKSDR